MVGRSDRRGSYESGLGGGGCRRGSRHAGVAQHWTRPSQNVSKHRLLRAQVRQPGLAAFVDRVGLAVADCCGGGFGSRSCRSASGMYRDACVA